MTVFNGEEQQYKEEGVPWTPIPYSDNADIIALIENTTNGIYTTLDSCCKSGSSTGQKFCAALHDAHAKSKVFGAPKVGKKENRSKTDHFVVKHFAGDGVPAASASTATATATAAPHTSSRNSSARSRLFLRRVSRQEQRHPER